MPIVLQLAETPNVGDPWVKPEDLRCTNCEDVDLESVAAAASELLHIASGRRYGIRRELVRPTVMSDFPLTRGLVGSWLAQGTMSPPWLDLRTSPDGTWAGGYRLNGPVVEVHAVKVGGVTLATNEYEVYDGRDLVRLTPSGQPRQWWPCAQRLDLADTEPDTWSIDYSWGKAVPYSGVLAAQALTCSLARMVQQGRCGTPDRATQTNRQGVTTNLLSPEVFAKNGRMIFGIRAVDLWLSAVNPSGGRRRSRFVGPDTPTGAVT